MGFQFSLAAVLRVRELVEEREERLLRQIVLEINQTLERLEHIRMQIAAAYEPLEQNKPAATATAFLGHHVHAAYGAVRHLIESREETEAHSERLGQLRDKQRAVYAAARRDRETLTGMFEEKKNAYDREAARQEQKVLDDNHSARRSKS